MRSKKDKIKQFEIIYRTYVNDVYRVSLYYSKDEKKAQKVTQQVFFELYKKLENVDSNHIFAYLVCKAKSMSTNEHIHETAKGEVRGHE